MGPNGFCGRYIVHSLTKLQRLDKASISRAFAKNREFQGTVNTPIITAVITVFNPLFRFGGGYNSREGTNMKFFLTNDTSESFLKHL